MKIKHNRNWVDFFFIIIVAAVLSIPLMNKKIDMYTGDGADNLFRAFWGMQNIISSGSSNIISQFVNGFGYSWDFFEACLPTYIIMAIGAICMSYTIGLKIVIFLIFVFTGLAMHRFIYEISENRNCALVAGILYMVSPYLFTSLFVRHAIGEAMIFAFLPMLFLGLYNLFNTESNHYYTVLGLSGIILCNNVMSALSLIFAGIYCVLNIKNFSSVKVKKGFLIDLIFVLAITAFFILPKLETRFFTNYEVYQQDLNIQRENFIDEAITLKELLISSGKTRYVFELGLPIILMLVFSVTAFRKIEDYKKEYLFCMILGILCTFMATKYFPWKYMPDVFFKLQKPWVTLEFASFFFAIVCSINMTTLIKSFNKKDILVIAIICIMYFVSTQGAIYYSDNTKDVKEYDIRRLSGQNNETLEGMGNLKNLPSKAYKNTFYIATRNEKIQVLQGICEIKNEEKNEGKLRARIVTSDEEIKLELPYIYYPGYSVKFDGMNIFSYETENGFLGCTIPMKENGVLEVKYERTKLNKIASLISLGTVIVYIEYVWKKH